MAIIKCWLRYISVIILAGCSVGCAEVDHTINVWPGETIEASEELIVAFQNCDWPTLDESCDRVREIAATGDPSARFLLAREEAVNSLTDLSTRIQAYEKIEGLAAEGFPAAQSLIGNTLLFHGRSAVPPANNPEQGLRYLQQAHEAGSATAAFALANAYLEGVGVEASNQEAMRLFQIASSRGHMQAGFEFAARALDGRYGNYPVLKIREELLRSAALDHYPAIDGICRNALQWYNSLGSGVEFEPLSTLMFTPDERALWCGRSDEMELLPVPGSNL